MLSAYKTIYFLVSAIVFFPCPVSAVEPGEIVVLANALAPDSVELARYYMEQRRIPGNNLLLLHTGREEWIHREQYDDEIAAPLHEFLAARPEITCLLLFYGLPLRIDGAITPDLFPVEADDYTIQRQRDPVASVDSELSLVKVAAHPINDWLPNPYFMQFQGEKTKYRKGEVLLVSRLDGPDAVTVKRIIDDSLEVEKKGLQGMAYFDARWLKPPEGQELSGYALYDDALHRAAELTGKVVSTVLDEREALFQQGEAPNAALYCGWYSLAHYVDAFHWQKGAVAYHIASAECRTLKQNGSQVWCKRLLEEGVVATIGPVDEPYVQGFPFPQLFFGLLLDGDFTLVEAYWLSLPFTSWKMVLIGDPLYQPFRQRGILP